MNEIKRNNKKPRKKISIVTPCYNEEQNVEALFYKVKEIMAGFKQYSWEHIFIDNCSDDLTVEILKKIAQKEKNLKLIVNVKNFMPNRSARHAINQADGDAIITLVADFQDPPEMIIDFIKKWEEGYSIVIGIKNKSRENPVMFFVRKIFYYIMDKITDIEHISNFSGFALYDKKYIAVIRQIDDPNPYGRGLVAEFGFDRYNIEYVQPVRKSGKSKNNFYTLFDFAMLGIVNYSKVPLRLAIFIGFILGFFSFIAAFVFFIYKLMHWDTFQTGNGPVVLGLFFFSSVQLFFTGIVGEYVGAIYTHVRKRPLVIEKERINF